MSVFEVRSHNGTPTLFMDGQPEFPAIFLANIDMADPAASAGVEERIQQFHQAGFKFFRAPSSRPSTSIRHTTPRPANFQKKISRPSRT